MCIFDCLFKLNSISPLTNPSKSRLKGRFDGHLIPFILISSAFFSPVYSLISLFGACNKRSSHISPYGILKTDLIRQDKINIGENITSLYKKTRNSRKSTSITTKKWIWNLKEIYSLCYSLHYSLHYSVYYSCTKLHKTSCFYYI